MKLSVIQFETLYKNKENNLKKINGYISEINSNILVFPELATSGYFYTDKNELRKIADNYESETIKKFKSYQQNLKKL